MPGGSGSGRAPWLARACAAAIALAALAGIVVPAGAHWDFANFYDTGARALHGQIRDIYHPASLIAGHAPQGKMTFWGVPISAYLYVPLALLPPAVALVLFKVLGTLATALGVTLLYRAAGDVAQRVKAGAPGEPLGRFLLALLLFQPFWAIYRVGGQTTPFVFLLLVLALGAYRRDRPARTALLLVLAVLFKPAFALVPALLLPFAGRRYLRTGVVAGALLGAASLLFFGWPIHREFLHMAGAGATKPAPWVFNSSLSIAADVVARALGQPTTGSAATAARAAVKLALLPLGLLVLWRGWSARLRPDDRRLLVYLFAVSLTLLLSQVVWEHYLALLFIPLAFLVALAPALSAGPRRVLAAIFLTSLGQNLVVTLFVRDHLAPESAGALLAVTLVKCAPLLLFLYLLLRHQAELLTAFGAPAPIAEPEARARAARASA